MLTRFIAFSWLPVALLLSQGCATAKLVGERSFVPPDPGYQRVVVIEPLFEVAEWQTTTKTEYARMLGGPGTGMGYGGYGSYGGYGGMPTTVAVQRQVQEKPLFAKPQVLAEVQKRLIPAVQRLRPSWRVTSTSGAPVLSGEVVVVRTIVEGNEIVESDRALKSAAFGFGLVIWPLEILAAFPVHESERVYGRLEKFTTTAELMKSRLVRYPTQPDYAVSLEGVTPVRREFGLDVTYEEGLLANEAPRGNVLIDGFVERLAAAVVAVLEEPAGAR